MKMLHKSIRKALVPLIFAGLLGTLLLTVLWERIIVVVPAGHSGVLWYLFLGGTEVASHPLGEGLHVILPWDRIFIYDMRLQTHTEDYDVVSKDGLQIRIRMHFRWRAIPPNLPLLTKTVGPNYLPKLLIPAIGSVLSEVVSQYKAEDIYSNSRELIESRVLQEATSDRVRNGIGLDSGENVRHDVIGLIDVLIREVILPSSVSNAIERKVTEAQYVQEYEYRIEREKLEATRKEIEATGIRRFQDTVTPGMSDSYLKWRGIEATQKLAESANSKIVIMGNGERGLPVLLNAWDDSVAAKAGSNVPTEPVAPSLRNALPLLRPPAVSTPMTID